MHILSTVARSITSRGLVRAEQIQSNHGLSVRFFTCSCSLCGAEASRQSDEGAPHSRLTLSGGPPVIVEHSNGANQSRASDPQAASYKPPEKPEASSAWGSFGSQIAKARPIPKVVKKDPTPTSGKGTASGSTPSSKMKTTTAAAPTRKAQRKSANQSPSPPASAQWGAFHSLQVHGPAPDPNPPPKPKPLLKPLEKPRARAGAPAPRWKRTSLPAHERAGKWGGFHQEQGVAASGEVEDEESLVSLPEGGERLVMDDEYGPSLLADFDLDPVVEGSVNLSLETSLSRDVGEMSEEVKAQETEAKAMESEMKKADGHQAYALDSGSLQEDGQLNRLSTERPVTSSTQHQPNAASTSINKREKARARAATSIKSRRGGPKRAAGTGTRSWGPVFEDVERDDPEIARTTGNEEEADAPPPPACLSPGHDATSGSKVHPEPTPKTHEEILPPISNPHELDASPAKVTPAPKARARSGFITQAEAAALIDRLSRERGVLVMKAPGPNPSEEDFEDSSTKIQPGRHEPAVQEDMMIVSREQALAAMLQEPVGPLPWDVNEHEHAAIEEAQTCHSQDTVRAEKRLAEERYAIQRLTEQRRIKEYVGERRAEERRIKEQERRTEELHMRKLCNAEKRVKELREEERRAHEKARQADERRAAEFRILERRIKELGAGGPSPEERLMERYANFQAMKQSHPSNIAKEALRDFDYILEELSTETVEHHNEVKFIRNWLYWLKVLVTHVDEGNIAPGFCDLCERKTHEITRHHVIPRTQRDRDRFTIEEMNELLQLCRPCHRALHRAIPNNEVLAVEFNSLARIAEHPRIQSWLIFAKAHSIRDLHGLMRPQNADGLYKLEGDERQLHLLRIEQVAAQFASRGRKDFRALRDFLKFRVPYPVTGSDLRHVLTNQKEGESWKGLFLENFNAGRQKSGDIVTETGTRKRNKLRRRRRIR
ncbi:hypothetical protein BDP81DRAFT_408414 [Colletotrichum phormii]|uniref:Uncharacterized protein n=1 Tax=Colletotrichum phormii TaxID=359342 RepID=A0AAJ0EEA1_9PEZI|nr:uncharacterized protein BDP81DRAFT_408414 [Colletotrichum phormii]KAK1633896.1 hypothetical protein BDP81DRAFT_408414 [Colletotrichum phormii]